MNNSKIEWTDHTFNPWWGCVKVSSGCKNCYAETLDNRWNGGHWGPRSSRKAMSEQYWRQPLKWNKDAEKSGVPAKVFCASMADVFEGHPDTLPHLDRLFSLIEKTPNLIWQLLTKRPQNILPLLTVNRPHWLKNFPENIWIGTSVEDQKTADERIPHLLKVPASVRFLSMEPLLGPVEFSDVTGRTDYPSVLGKPALAGIHWVIVGGESGPNARPINPGWVRSIQGQCSATNIPFFFKQWGEWGLDEYGVMKKVGKKAAGRLLDGVEYNEFPQLINQLK